MKKRKEKRGKKKQNEKGKQREEEDKKSKKRQDKKAMYDTRALDIGKVIRATPVRGMYDSGGEKGRHLWPRLVQELESKSVRRKKKKKKMTPRRGALAN